MLNHYQVLGLVPSCSADDIKKSFHKLAKQFHPDKAQQQSSQTSQSNHGVCRAFQQVSEAYSVLKNAASRRAYDQTLLTFVHQQQRPRQHCRSTTSACGTFASGATSSRCSSSTATQSNATPSQSNHDPPFTPTATSRLYRTASRRFFSHNYSNNTHVGGCKTMPQQPRTKSTFNSGVHTSSRSSSTASSSSHRSVSRIQYATTTSTGTKLGHDTQHARSTHKAHGFRQPVFGVRKVEVTTTTTTTTTTPAPRESNNKSENSSASSIPVSVNNPSSNSSRRKTAPIVASTMAYVVMKGYAAKLDKTEKLRPNVAMRSVGVVDIVTSLKFAQQAAWTYFRDRVLKFGSSTSQVMFNLC